MIFCIDIKKSRIILLIIFLILLPLVVYICNFHDKDISKSTMDWGAFGSYLGGVVSLLSVFLLFFTYREQRRANSISQFEQRYYTQLKTIRNKVEELNDYVKTLYFCIELHFHENKLNILNREDILMACAYYYKDLRSQDTFRTEIEYLFLYIIHSIKMTSVHETLSASQKNDYIQDLCPLLYKDVLILLLFYVIYREDVSLFNDLRCYNCYDGLTTKNTFFDEILVIILSANHLKMSSIVNRSAIEFDSYERETISETIKRLKQY